MEEGSILRRVPSLGGGGAILSKGCHEGESSMKEEGAVKERFHERGCHEGTVNKWAVRILLECILVIIVVDTCTM